MGGPVTSAVVPSAAAGAGAARAAAQPDEVAIEADDAPVAVSQEAMLWHECFVPGSFNLPCLVRRYQGPLDVEVFRWALSEIVRRHQPLRSTFAVVDGEARQRIGDGASSLLAVLDLGPLAPAERDDEVARILAEATGRPFDLVSGPLFEPRLLRLGPDDHLLVVRLHHSVFDDWSVDVFRRELSALYTSRCAGSPSPLIEPTTSFADFSRRQRARLSGDDGASQRSWWRQELDGGPLAVQLPLAGEQDRSADAAAGEPLRIDLPPELAAVIRRLAPTLRATPFMTVLAAFSALLGRITGQDDLVIATVVANRNRSDVEPLVGCFTKKVPIRLRLHGDPTFAELVGRTRASLLGALAHQDVAFDAAVQEGLGRSAADHGVVPQVAVVFQGETPQQVTLALAGLSAGPYTVRGEARRERHFTQGPSGPLSGDQGPSGPLSGDQSPSGPLSGDQSPSGPLSGDQGPSGPLSGDQGPEWGDGIYLGTFLILSLLETAEGMALVARGVFDRPAGRRLLEEFQSLLAEVVVNPSRPVSTLYRAGPDRSSRADVVDLRGFPARRSHIEAALARCLGVADVAVAVRDDAGGERRLVAYVVPSGESSPTLAELRHALWATRPGAPWPSLTVAIDKIPRLPDGRLDVDRLPPPDPAGAGTTAGVDPVAGQLTAMWEEIAGRPVTADTSYWQDFSFLQVLAEARQAGIAIPDEQVVRCRTPRTLAAALAVAPRPPQA